MKNSRLQLTARPESKTPAPGNTPPMIVLTGGPGAGKTAVLELARTYFCAKCVVIPEAASVIFSGGFWRRESATAREAAQRAIFHVQRELEAIALDDRGPALILCDRGTLDGLAYWPGSEAKFFQEIGTTRETELGRYAAVIHMHTPDADGGYNHSNPQRIETAEEAATIDRKIVLAWEGHPARHFVHNTPDFLAKAQLVLGLISQYLPPDCEIESRTS